MDADADEPHSSQPEVPVGGDAQANEVDTIELGEPGAPSDSYEAPPDLSSGGTQWWRRARRLAGDLGREVRDAWHEVRDSDAVLWLPSWFYAAGLVLVAAIGLWLVPRLTAGVGTSSTVSAWVLVIEVPLRSYIEHHSRDLPVSSANLMSAWAASGLILLLFAWLGHLGARIGWVVFGLMSCGAVYAGAEPPTQWTVAGVAAMAWSGVTIIAFWRPQRRPSRQRARLSRHNAGAEGSLDELRRRAQRSARGRGYRDLDEYFADRGTQLIDTIASELQISSARVSELRADYLEEGVSTRSRLTIRQQRDLKGDILAGTLSNSELCAKHGCPMSTVRRTRAKLRAGGNSRGGSAT